MVMGYRQQLLKKIIMDDYAGYRHPKIDKDAIKQSGWYSEVCQVYFQLGGQMENAPLRFGGYDIATKNFIIELDEERHFNRYRAITLTSNIYHDYQNFNVGHYLAYCTNYENMCLKTAGWGNNWKNHSTERMFIQSDPIKQLQLNGSSRWRQRAYYDFLKDLNSLLTGIRLFRICIYDEWNGLTVDDLLRMDNRQILREFIASKLTTNSLTI
jgi:hypothetical protein